MAKAPKVLILNGPNLNMLGTREPEIYGSTTLPEIETRCRSLGKKLGLAVECLQSNSEGELIDTIQLAQSKKDGIIINPGAYTHTSIAILDALSAADLPIIEVHLSNIHKRESFRQTSYVSKVANGVICGFGPEGYHMALEAMANMLIEQVDL